MTNDKTKIITLFTLILLGWLAFSSTSASDQQLILTYKDVSFYPSNYQGKAPGVFGSELLISAVGIENSKIIDLSRAKFIWRINDNYTPRTGTGLDRIKISSSKSDNDEYIISVTAELNGKQYKGSIKIPTATPKVTIEAITNSREIMPNQKISMKLIPYFFNVNSLNQVKFYWSLNDETNIVSNNQIFVLDTDKYKPYNKNYYVTGTVISKINELVNGKSQIIFNYLTN